MHTLSGESGQCSSRSVTTPYPNSPLTTSTSTRCGCSRTHQPRKHPPSATCRQLSVIRLSSAANFTHQARHHTSTPHQSAVRAMHSIMLTYSLFKSGAQALTREPTVRTTAYQAYPKLQVCPLPPSAPHHPLFAPPCICRAWAQMGCHY